MKNAAAKLPKAGHADGFCYVFRYIFFLTFLTLAIKIICFKKLTSNNLVFAFSCTSTTKLYNKMINSPEDEESKIQLRTIEAITQTFTNFAKYGQVNLKCYQFKFKLQMKLKIFRENEN